MDDAGRCLLDVIGDPSALEFFLGSSNEHRSDAQSISIATNELKRAGITNYLTSSHLITGNTICSSSNAILCTTVPQSTTALSATGQVIPNHAPVQSSSPSPFQAPAPSPAASPTLSVASKSPMPPPAQSPSSMSSRRSPAQVPVHSMPCPSPTGYPITQSPSTPQGLYPVRSPASSPSPASFTPLQLNKVQTPTSMAPATINILQPQPAALPTASVTPPSTVISSAAALQQLPATAIPVGGQIMQIIQAPHQTPTIRHQPSIMKPIQPKPQQILPKPAGAASQNPYGKSVALSQRTAVSLTPSQANSLVLGQGQTMIPSSNVHVGPQGTLLLNHISLGVGQNNILFPGNGGLPHNLQLLVRPQPPHNASNTASQSAATMAQASSMNNAFLTALHVQNQAAQQAFIGQTKALAGQGQTMVIPGQNLGAAGQGQLSNAGLRQGMIGGARVVGQSPQGPLVLQQIQGPITVIQALQGHNMGQLGGMLQGQAFQGTVGPGLQQSIVLNNQHQSVITTSAAGMPTLVNQVSDPSSVGQIAQVSHLHTQQQNPVTSHLITHSQQPSQPKPHGVNLEELLKQAGIMPEDSPPSPPAPTTQVPMSVDPQPIASFAQMTTLPAVTSQCMSTVNGPQTVVVNQEHIPGQTAQSPLLAHLQQPIMSSQLHTTGAMQGQVKLLSLAQDGSVIIQRPCYSTQGPTLSISPSQQQMTSQQMTIPVACFSTATTTTTTTVSNVTSTVPVSSQQVQSVLLQRLNSVQQVQGQPVAHQQPSPSSSPASNATTSIIPVAVQGMNVNLVQGLQSSACNVSSSGGMLPVMSASAPQTANVSVPAFSSAANTILSSMLSQTNPMLAQSLAQDGRTSSECITNSYKQTAVSSIGTTFVPNGNKILHQSPLLIQSLQTLNPNMGSLTTIPVSSASVNLTSASSSVSHATMMTGDANHIVPVSFAFSAVPTFTNSVSTTATSNLTMPKNTAPRVILSGYPFANLQPGQKVQTIQLTHQAQEALQKVQAQLQALSNHKPLSVHQRKQIQQLQMEQQKILSQGKLISVQQQPMNQHVQMNQQQTQLQQVPQPRYLQQKPATNVQNATHKNNQASHKTSLQAKSSINVTNNNSTLTSTLIQGTPHMASFQVATTLSTTQAILTSSASPLITTAASTTHLKLGNQIIALTAQQQRPLQQHAKALTPEQQQQVLYQNHMKQQRFLKLHQQQQLQQQQQATNIIAHSSQDQPIAVAPNVQTLNFTGGILQIQTMTPGVTHLKPLCPAIFPEQGNRGMKRPASMPLSRTARIQQQLANDQNGVLHPDCDTPFQSREDACKRLMRYHVYNNRSPTVKDLDRADNLFETVSGQLIEKARLMCCKYSYLLLRESMKGNTTAEQVMLDRMFMQEETSSLEKDRQAVKEGKYLDLPPAPEHWLKIKDEVATELPEATTIENDLDVPRGINNFTNASNFDVSCVKVEPDAELDSKAIPEYEDVSDNNSSVSAEYNRREDEVTIKQEKVRNYDEWAEIQKELEMYPIENDDLGTRQMEFEPPDDNTGTLADFEPPLPKIPKNDDGSSGDNSLHFPSSQSHPAIVLQPQLLLHHAHQQPYDTRHLLVENHTFEMEADSDWDEALSAQVGVSAEPASSCASSATESEPVENLLIRHQRNSPEDASDLGLGDMDELEEHYTNAVTEDEDSLSRRLPRTNHVGNYEESNSCEMAGLFGNSFKSSPTICDVPNGSFDKSSQDDDLNAQVQSAINSILNLQRIDDSCDAFVMTSVMRDDFKVVQMNASNNNANEDDEDEDEDEEEEEEEEEENSAASGSNSHYTFSVEKHKVLEPNDEEDDEEEEDEDEDIDNMDYEAASAAAADMDSFHTDGPSEIDVALDEAVKSILL